ncbi:DUF4838 domain-containing protein [Paenibacillus sp. GYB004]|uniref:DUF4838 domain-containing protein n=1 Tax=Paenibacillus sp. GYB004 TaxID=2994393 RepID=UPI002F967C0F
MVTRRKIAAGILMLVAASFLFYSLALAEGNAWLNKTNGNGKKVLAHNGNVMYSVYVSESADAIVKHAAQELADYLTQVSGAPFDLTISDGTPIGPAFLVGQHPAADSFALQGNHAEPLGEDGFIIQSAGPYIQIIGSSSRGTMNGVNYFLDRYVGVKWFSPTYTFIPDKPKLKVSVGYDVQIPRFQYREMFVNDGNNEQFRAHNLLNGKSHYRTQTPSAAGLNSWSDYVPTGVHNFHALVTDSVYHSGGQVLAMDEEVRRIAAQALVSRIGHRQANGLDPSYGFSQQDAAWVPDPASRSFADAHGGTLAAPILDMVGDVASRVRTQIPDARIGTLAYQFSYPAPTGLTLPDNVVVTLAPIDKDHGKSLDGAGNERDGQQIAKWAALSDQLVFWDYLTNFSGGGYLQPYPNLYAMADTIQFLALSPAVKGYFGQQTGGARGPVGVGFDELRTWVGARLLWNPDEDVNALIEEFINGYYGAASSSVSEYIEAIHQSLEDSGASLTTSTPISSPYLSFDTMHQADGLFEQAEAAAAGDPALLDRVRRMRIGVDLIILHRRAEFAQEAGERNIVWNLDTTNRLQRFKSLTQNMQSFRIENGELAQLYQLLEVERSSSPIPDIVQNLPDEDWIELQDYDFRLHAGAAVVQDVKASDQAAARLSGSSTAWGIQMNHTNLPREGRWKLYAYVRVDPGSGSSGAGAFRFGLYPSQPAPVGVTFGEVSDGEYHAIEMPWVYKFNPELSVHYLWFQPAASGAIHNLYVDRIVAVREKPPAAYNPGFETIAPGGPYPDGWQTAGGVWDSGTAHGGSRSIRLDPEPANAFHVIYTGATKWIPVVPGQKYQVKGWIKNNSTNGNVSLGVRQINASNGSISYSWHPGALPSSDWTPYTVTFTAAPTARYVSIYFKSDQQTDGPAWLDDVSIEEVP